MKKTYDLIFPLGMGCSASQSLRRAGLQHLSFPGDWIGPLYGDATWAVTPTRDLRFRADNLCGDGAGFFDEGDFEFIKPHPWNGMDMYSNRRTHYLFNHDFPGGVPLSESLPKVRMKYRRRWERMEACIARGSAILVFRLDRPDVEGPTPTEDLVYLRNRLSEKYPGKVFEILNFRFRRGIAVADRVVEEVAPGVTTVAYDYDDPSPWSPAYQPDFNKVVAVLREMADVREYRTPAEIRAWQEKCRRQRWATVDAANEFEYRVRKVAKALAKVRGWLPKRPYDLVVPMGIACSCSQILREAKLQLLSFPNDWAGPDIGSADEKGDLGRRVDAICSGFAHWFDREDLSMLRELPEHNEVHYRNLRTQNIHPHDFKCDKPFDAAYPVVRERYERRIARFMGLFRGAQRVLFVRIDRPDQPVPTATEDILDARRRLCEAFPEKKIDFVHLTMERGRAPRNCRVEKVSPGVTRLACDYANRLDNGAPSYYPDLKAAASCLTARYRVRDYRSSEERAAWKRKGGAT